MVIQRKENQFRVEQGEYVFIGLRTDPYGFWNVKGTVGKRKIDLVGEFTSADDAIKAVEKRLNNLSQPIVEKII